MYLFSVVSEPSNYDICHIDIGIILTGEVIQASQCVVFAEIKECQVRD